MSLVYLDTDVSIYVVEGPEPFLSRASARLDVLMASGDRAAYSDLTRLECRVKPLAMRNAGLLADYETFFAGLLRVPLSAMVYERAAQIRADYRIKLGDALHLAAAVESGCVLFLTNDGDLSRFRDLAVEVLS